MTVAEFLAALANQHPAVQQYEIRTDGDTDYIPDDLLDEIYIDHEAQRIYLIWSNPEKEYRAD